MNPRKNVAIIILFLVVLSIAIWELSIILQIWNQKFNSIVINPIYGIAGGLFTFAITLFITQRYLFSAKDNVDDIINTISSSLKGSLLLHTDDRKELLGKGYYDTIYNRSTDIRICSISLNRLIEYICKPELRNKNSWVNRLRNRPNVSVKIVMMSPDSDIVKILDEQEKDTQKKPSFKINETIELLKNFAGKNTEEGLAEGTSINIVLSKQTINFSITYAALNNVKRNQEDIMLIGLIYGYKDNGPFYHVPQNKTINVYNDCINYFDKLYDNRTKPIFQWDITGKKFYG